MRRVILQEFVSLDGLASGPNDSVDFVPASTQHDEGFGNKSFERGTVLLGYSRR